MVLDRITIKGVTLVWPHIYEGHQFAGQDRVKYGTGFTADTKAQHTLAEHGIYPKYKDDMVLFNTTSRFAPTVTADDYGPLEQAFDVADIRNLKRDRLLRNVDADLVLEVFEYNSGGRKGRGISLLEVVILDTTKVLRAAHKEQEPCRS